MVHRIAAWLWVCHCFVCLSGSSSVAWAQPLTAVGDEFQVNVYTTNYQRTPAVAIHGDRSFVVVWESGGQDFSDYGIVGRRFDSAGVPQGGEFVVNSYVNGDQTQPAVASAADGGFLVVWTSFGSNGDDSEGRSVQARRFDSSGTALGLDMQLNTWTTGAQEEPSVAATSDGFLVVWESFGADGNDDGIRGRRLDSAGQVVGDEWQINASTTGRQVRPAVAASDNGYVVVWDSVESVGRGISDGSGIRARRFDTAGVALGDDFVVNTYTAGDQQSAGLAVTDDGRLFVAWERLDGVGSDIYGRRFDAAGTGLGSEFQVNTYTTGTQRAPVVGADGDGNFVVLWESSDSPGTDTSSDSVIGRVVSPAGSFLSDDLQLNTYTTDFQSAPAVAGTDDGRFIVGWSSFETIGRRMETSKGIVDSRSVRAQRFDLTAVEVSVPESTAAASGETVDVPLSLATHGQSVSSLAFSIDLDDTCLGFDPTDLTMDGLPDALAVSVPADFDVTAFYDAVDTDGELDLVIADVPPEATLTDGVLATVTLDVLCAPDPGTTLAASVEFSPDPAVSAGDTAGQAVAGRSKGGAVAIYPGARGDCNGDLGVDAADVGAAGLELFDGDGSTWLDVAGGTFAGQPVGCDANADTAIDAGDTSCMGRLIFGMGCDDALAGARPSVLLPRTLVPVGGAVTAAVDFAAGGRSITSLAFSIDVDTSALGFDPADNDFDGIPDAVRFNVPGTAVEFADWDPADTDGELDILITSTSASPSTVTDGSVVEIDFTALSPGAPVVAGVVFADQPAPSFGEVAGYAVAGDASVGEPLIFTDGFESGGTGNWSAVVE